MGLARRQVVVAGQAMYAGTQIAAAICRIISGWQSSKEDIIRLMAGMLSATQQADNVSLFTDGKVHWQADLMNPTATPIRCELLCLTIKKDEPGFSIGTWQGTGDDLPFAVGSSGNNANAPQATNWEFWNQDPRVNIDGAQINAQVAFAENLPMTFNIAGAYSPPVPGGLWETTADTTAGYADPFNRIFWRRMTEIFPLLSRKLKIRTVFKGVIKPLSGKKLKWRTKFPKKIDPFKVSQTAYNNLQGGVTHFYFLRALSTRPVGKFTTAAIGAANYADHFHPAYHVPAQIHFIYRRTYNCRVAQEKNANMPSYGAVTDNAPANALGWMAATAGDPYIGFNQAAQGATIAPDVTSYKVKSLPYFGMPAVAGGSINAAGAAYPIHQ